MRSIGLAVSVLALGQVVFAVDPPLALDPSVLAQRQEYNGVAASIDSIVRVYGEERLQRLADPQRSKLQLPPGFEVVLMFWADDEAAVYMNGAPVGRTRLTPTRVTIPAAYIEPENQLDVHCWDTDRVESGFLAGLYVQDLDGALHTVLASGEQHWQTGGEVAEEIFYSHTLPDIPDAAVIWGRHLYGQVRMQASFTGAEVRAAVGRAPAGSISTSLLHERPMDFHRIVGRLASLQERKGELEQSLRAQASHPDPHLRSQGTPSWRERDLTYTLGKAGPLREKVSLSTTSSLAEWVSSLPQEEMELLVLAARSLKGPDAATPAVPLEPGEEGSRVQEEDRRQNYVPPPDRGREATRRKEVSVIPRVLRAPSNGFIIRMSLLLAALAVWTGFAGERWWKLFRCKGADSSKVKGSG